jgi:translation initiation factor IF-1
MSDSNLKEYNGQVTAALPNTMFKIVLEDGREVLATLKGRLRKNFIRIFPGDKVKVEMSPYDVDRGRISYKY